MYIVHTMCILLIRGGLRNGNLKWHLPLGVGGPPPLNGTNFQTFYYPIFSFAFESYINETDFILGLSQISLLSPLIIGSDIDILMLLRLLTAN